MHAVSGKRRELSSSIYYIYFRPLYKWTELVMTPLDIQNNTSTDSVRPKNTKRDSTDTPHNHSTNNNVIPKTTQTGFIARLHAFLPPNFTSSSNIQSVPEVLKPPQPNYLKIRIITWNMHDSLPKARGLAFPTSCTSDEISYREIWRIS